MVHVCTKVLYLYLILSHTLVLIETAPGDDLVTQNDQSMVDVHIHCFLLRFVDQYRSGSCKYSYQNLIENNR